MALVTFVKSARKPQGNCLRCNQQINKGDGYFWFANLIGRTSTRKVFCASHRPKQSDMTTSDKLAALYAAQENLEAAIATASSVEDITAALQDAIAKAEQVRDEYQESLSNMPEQLQSSAFGEAIQKKIDSIEEWISSLEYAVSDVESLEEETKTADDGEDNETGTDADTDTDTVLSDARDIADAACSELGI